MAEKQDTFKHENVFMLAGHGAEAIDRDLPRYILGQNEYLAMFNLPGEVGTLADISFYNNFYNDKKIAIPTSKDKYLVSKDYFGSLGGLRRRKNTLSEFIKMVIVEGISKIIEFHTNGFVYYNKPLIVKPIENFKLYHPREEQEELNYKNTTPNLIYYPGVYFHNLVLDSWIKEHFMFIKQNNQDKIKQNPAHINIKYKNKIYSQMVYDLGFMTLIKSGIMRKSNSPPVFKKTDIDDYNKGFDKIMEHGIHIFGTLPSPFDGTNDGVITIFYPQNMMSKSLGAVIGDKNKDPLAYDFLCWYKAAYNESILTFDDLCLIAIASISVKHKLPRYKEFIKTLVTLSQKDWVPFQRFIPYKIGFIFDGIPKIFGAIVHYIHSYFDTDFKPYYNNMTEFGEIFLDMKKKLSTDEIKTLSLALTMDDILQVSINIETVYKFIKLYGQTNNEPFMVVPLICRSTEGYKSLINEKIKLTRPKTLKKKLNNNITNVKKSLNNNITRSKKFR